jgi:hypothetical protein
LIVDFGKSSELTKDRYEEQMNARIVSLESLRRGEEDFASLRALLRSANGRLIDAEGVDWWTLLNVLLFKPLDDALLLVRLSEQLDAAAELHATRPGWPMSGLGLLLNRRLHYFPSRFRPTRMQHYGEMLRRFSLGQLSQIFLDKYDSRLQWRSKFASRRRDQRKPPVLLPSAYTNVSRMAVAYARMLPAQQFLVVATRRSGTHFDAAPNVSCVSLASYAGGAEPHAEYREMLAKWQALKESMALFPGMNVLSRAGLLEEFPTNFRNGLAVRNAWRNVLSEEKVLAVMCGDDNNPNTALPVLLARRQGIPTMDFHHGALDRSFMLKELPADCYLAKGEMERDYLIRVCHLPSDRVVVAGPPRPQPRATADSRKRENSTIIFFSEPYETGGWRTEEVYREILPPLSKIAREAGRTLTLKLHPFESRQQRASLLKKVLGVEDAALIDIVEGPFTAALVAHAWFAVTVESTTVLDCTLLGVPCFVCGWLTASSPHGYTRQYARFGIGQALDSAEKLNNLPQLLTEPSVFSEDALLKPADPEWLRRRITSGACRGSKGIFPAVG